MMAEITPILVLICISCLSLGVAAVLSIRSKKSTLQVLGATEEKDFIDEVIADKKKSLEKGEAVINWNQYKTLLTVFPVILGVFSFMLLETKAMCIVFAAFGLLVPELIIMIGEKNRKKKFDEQYALALKTLSSSLRAGKSIIQSIDSVGTSPFVEKSIQKGFRQISSDIKVGVSLEEAFKRFAIKTKSEDAYDVAASLSMQAKVGGSEAMVINTIAQNISERIMTRKEINMIFAETDILINVLEVFPWAVLAFLYVFTPQFIQPFFQSTEMTLILVCIMMFTLLGSFIIRRMARTAKSGG